MFYTFTWALVVTTVAAAVGLQLQTKRGGISVLEGKAEKRGVFLQNLSEQSRYIMSAIS